MTKAYWVAHVTVTDSETYQSYRAAAAPVLENAGARILALGGKQETVSGKMRPHTVIVEFPSIEAARDCYFGAAYQATIPERDKGADVDLSIVEGL
ncbi:hypothetical protein BVC71_14195 [Marivivens niveibacter]|uniref:DUF1330 domain-containing protein n=1 Tax=Marivivens niveibacter TaxID=1930667 RepID=A0A251WW12_9RHOB|nr:DUF1330 domain-containing protein [Marivivens niveibacter]OUD08318.1 hypothetical protein BVC71_14195 [Marivivens niveibacter]